MSCEINCLKTPKDVRKFIDSESITPFVKVSFYKDINANNVERIPLISFGNESSSQFENTAFIKSFQYGFSSGFGGKLEIVDEKGGAFDLFSKKLAKCIKGNNPSLMMNVTFGWIDQKKIIKSTSIDLQPGKLNVEESDGKMKYSLEATNLHKLYISKSIKRVYGGDKHISIKQAIQKLSQDEEPRFQVIFKKIEQDGSLSDLEFMTGGTEGPLNVWHANNENKIDTISRWISGVRTKNNKGFVILYVPEKTNTVLILEDPFPNCDDSFEDNNNIGTYIVRGGNCGNVYGFTWGVEYASIINQLLGAGGGTGGGADAGNVNEDNIQNACREEYKKAGVAFAITVNSQDINNWGLKEAAEQKLKSFDKSMKANTYIYSGIGLIEAELRIQGDTDLSDVLSVYGKFVSIIYINPFYIGKKENSSCGDWLHQPSCSKILSSNRWLISGIDHNISNGSYITTIKVKLPSPGIQVENSDIDLENTCN